MARPTHKICCSGGKPGLVGSRKKRYISANFWYLIRSRIESGPPGTRSFLLPEPARLLPRRDLLGQIGWTDSLLDSPNPT
jgi:hypothetical protein